MDIYNRSYALQRYNRGILPLRTNNNTWLALICAIPFMNHSRRRRLLQCVQRQQLFENFGLRGLPNLARQEHLVHDTVHLVEVEHQVQLAHIVEVLVEHLDKVVDRLQVAQVVVVHVHADAEVQPSVAAVDYLEVPELKLWEDVGLDKRTESGRTPVYLDKVGVLGITDCDQGMHLLD